MNIHEFATVSVSQGELLAINAALPQVATSRMYSVELPNSANVSFSYQYFLLLAMIMYIPSMDRVYYNCPSLLEPSILRPPLIIRPLELVQMGHYLCYMTFILRPPAI